MAEDVLDRAIALRGLTATACRTRNLPLVGAPANPVATLRSPTELPSSLVARYGAEAPNVIAAATCERPTDPVADGIDVIRAEFEYAVTHEGALTVDDILDRRTRIGLVAADRDRAVGCGQEFAPSRHGHSSRAELPGIAVIHPTPPRLSARAISVVIPRRSTARMLAAEMLRGYSGMFLCRPRRAGASASAWVSMLRVCAGSIFSSTTPISMALSTPPAIRSCSAASSSCSASRVLGRGGGQRALVQDADRGLGAHHGDLGVRPREHLGGAQRPRVHRDVGAAVDLAGDQRDARNGGLAERVQQLGAAAHHAAPLLVDAGQVAGHVDDDDERNAERVAQPHETRCLLGTLGVQAAAEAQRVVGEHADACGRPAGRGRPPSTAPTWPGTPRTGRRRRAAR